MPRLEPALQHAVPAGEELLALEERQQRLQLLVGELLQTNEELRLKVARLEAQNDPAQPEGMHGIV
jgi:hypothetical protein